MLSATTIGSAPPLASAFIKREPRRNKIHRPSGDHLGPSSRSSGGLKKESDALIDQVRAIDNRRLVQGPLSRLQPPQIDAVAEALLEVFDLADS